ncbi:MAG: BON domain-containing protein [Arsenophonus sp.]|nr:MAG: BON domain-containing protein [Arsenophonus sp.]
MRVLFLTTWLFLIGIILNGCTGTTMIGSAFVVTKSAVDSRSLGTQIDDLILSSKINTIIYRSKFVKFNQKIRIIPIVYSGKVLLIGQVNNSKLLKKIEYTILSKIKEISTIYNEVRILDVIKLQDILVDTWITTQLKLKILRNINSVKVITENKEVFLFGFLKKKEANKIASIASKIKNVKKVITVFTYQD